MASKVQIPMLAPPAYANLLGAWYSSDQNIPNLRVFFNGMVHAMGVNGPTNTIECETVRYILSRSYLKSVLARSLRSNVTYVSPVYRYKGG
jgi:hypothetical protein